jgi:formyltetrahydrofolate-dependent phosphoribosylglycinamide formyltransferase
MTRLAIMVGPKGRGSNMAAIARACASGELEARVATIIAPKDTGPAVETARALGLHVDVIEPGDDYGPRLLATLTPISSAGDGASGSSEGSRVDFICLAGYLRLLPSEVLHAFPRRVLNIHPALLPKFGGKGMYGIRVHAAVLESGERESGASVHYVTEHYDEGDVIAQRTCPVLPGDTPELLAGRVLQEEHKVYVEALRKVIGEVPA